jgi:ATP phosphoribosyltransferase regulatory subunit HisZ
VKDDKEVIRLVTNSLSDICRKTEGMLIGAYTVGDATAGIITGKMQDPDRAQHIARAMGSSFGAYVNTIAQEASSMGIDFEKSKETFSMAIAVAFAAGLEEIVKSGQPAHERKSEGQPFPTPESFEKRLVRTGGTKKPGGKR